MDSFNAGNELFSFCLIILSIGEEDLRVSLVVLEAALEPGTLCLTLLDMKLR